MTIPELNPDFPGERYQSAWKDIKRLGVSRFESRNRKKDGQLMPVEVSAQFLQFDGRQLACCFSRDITDRKGLEEQLRQSQKLEAIGQLAAGIAHEINTPTQYVSDNTNFLKEAWLALSKVLSLARSLREETSAGHDPLKTLERLSESVARADLDYVLQEVPQAIAQSLEGLQRVAKIVRAMKEFSHPGAGEKSASTSTARLKPPSRWPATSGNMSPRWQLTSTALCPPSPVLPGNSTRSC